MFFYTLLAHVAGIPKKRPALFLGVLALFLGIYSFFFAVFTIPLPGGVLGFYRMSPLTQFDYIYIGLSSLLSSLIAVTTFYKVRLKIPIKKQGREIKGGLASTMGLATGILGAVCPACLGINLLLLGNVFTAQLSFLIPYIFWVQLGGIAFLLLGLYFVAKSSYEKKCLTCDIKVGATTSRAIKSNSTVRKIVIGVLVGATVVLLVFQISLAFDGNPAPKKENGLFDDQQTVDINTATLRAVAQVTPADGFKTRVKWGNVVSKMIAENVLDPIKLEAVLKNRYGQEMKPEWRAILAGEDRNLEINSDNAVFMMYLLWLVAKGNNNQILFDSPFAKYFKNYDIGVGQAGYGNAELLTLTPQQQQVAREVAENASRPCCNNTTAQPDCSHGYSALGLVELMASQDFSKREMFDVFVKFNSFWFPETYVKNALYFKFAEGKDWNQVDKELVAGKSYSSLTGTYKVKNYLKGRFGI